MTKDIRWHQRLQNFSAALAELTRDINITSMRKLTRSEERGLIQAFEFTYELAWNVMKDFYANEGDINIGGSRSAIRLAFKRGLIEHGQLWMNMIDDRIITVHTYNKELADQIAEKIITKYYPEFVALEKKLIQLKKEQS